MTKRRIEREIEEERETSLRDLSPDERLELYLEAQAKGRETWEDILIETCPVYRYRGLDDEFTARHEFATNQCLLALYELHTTLLEFKNVKQRQRLMWLIDWDRDDDPSEARLEQATEQTDHLQLLFSRLYSQYHAHRKFATEILGIDLETWFKIPQNGEAVLEGVTDVLNDPALYDLAEEDMNSDAEPGDDEWTTLDDLAEIEYEAHRRQWSEAVGE